MSKPLLLAALLLAVPLAGCLDAPVGDPFPAPDPGAGDATSGGGESPPGDSGSGEPPGDGAPPPASATGPAWSLEDTDGNVHSRDSAAGGPSVLFFMATWCSSCRSKTGMLASLHDDYADRGVSFFSVGQDPTERAEDLEAWKSRYDQGWPHGVDRDRAVQRAFGVTAQSSFVVLDAEGEVVKRWGYPGASEAALRAAIDEALGS